MENTEQTGALFRTYIVPPFSILDTGAGPWQSRRQGWYALGLRSEEGRDGDLIVTNPELTKLKAMRSTGTSVFDPLLAECMIEWFCPREGLVLDPFAGGSVRGLVAAFLGRKYVGIELRPEQVTANENQRKHLLPAYEHLLWICGDSDIVLPTLSYQSDMILTCPPYGDLEVYGDDPADLSVIAKQEHSRFLEVYRRIIQKAAIKLKEDRFAVFVVGDYRDKTGFYRNFIGETVTAAEAAGLRYYNEAILVNPAGTLPLRVGGYMQKSRKLGRRHQNVLIFVKGDPRKATQACLLNAPEELGYKDLPTISKPKRGNTRRNISVGVATKLQNETPIGDGRVRVEDSVAVGTKPGELGCQGDGGGPITDSHVTFE